MDSTERPIDASQVTKPIQLLAAWLVGLIAINGSFLGAAALIKSPDWAPGLLVAAAIANVPIFLFCLFLLQTKFRPEMQEDSYYSRHLERKFSAQSQKIQTVEILRAQSYAKPPRISAPNLLEDKKIRTSKFVSVNDLLDNYQNIVKNLEQIGIRPAQTFGSTSHNPFTPKRFVVSVGTETPPSLAKQVLIAMKEFGLEGVGVGYDEADREMIYIGAYSYDDRQNYLPVSSHDFEKLVDPETTDRAFFKILAKYEQPEIL